MRLLVKLKCLKDQVYDLKYHHKLQGFIYNLLDHTSYKSLHDRTGYKFFCFSNIFPPKDMKTDSTRSLLISSPARRMINAIEKSLKQLQKEGKPANIGEMLFKIGSISRLEPTIGSSCKLITGTPIVIRIPKENYEKYGISPPKDYNCVYWRKNYSFEAFIKQLEDNLFKKYNEFYGKHLEKFPLFEQFMLKRSVCNHVVFGGKEIKIIGSTWEFLFTHLDKRQERLLQFGLDSGFGELNSIGFGFMSSYNTKNRRRKVLPKVVSRLDWKS